MLADGLELLPVYRPAAISGEDHEVANWPEGSVKVFV